MTLLEVGHLIEALQLFEGMVGKEGPCYFDCGVVNHCFASDEADIFPIGRKGKLVTMSDIMETLRQVRDDETISEWYYSGRSFFHEGYRLSGDGKTVTMIWGS